MLGFSHFKESIGKRERNLDFVLERQYLIGKYCCLVLQQE